MWKDGGLLGTSNLLRLSGEKWLYSYSVMLNELISCKCQGEVIKKLKRLITHYLVCNFQNQL